MKKKTNTSSTSKIPSKLSNAFLQSNNITLHATNITSHATNLSF